MASETRIRIVGVRGELAILASRELLLAQASYAGKESVQSKQSAQSMAQASFRGLWIGEISQFEGESEHHGCSCENF